jgi:hypothetical protein
LDILQYLSDKLEAVKDGLGIRKADTILRRLDESIDKLESAANELRVAAARGRAERDAADSEARVERKTVERLLSEESKITDDPTATAHLRLTIDKHRANAAEIDNRRKGLEAHLELLDSGLREITAELEMMRNNRSVLGERLTLASARQKLYRSKGGVGERSRWELQRELAGLVRHAELTAESTQELIRSRCRG